MFESMKVIPHCSTSWIYCIRKFKKKKRKFFSM